MAPVDRLRIRYQVYVPCTGSSKLVTSQMFKSMIAEGGIKSLWQGNGTNVLRIAPESAIRLTCYENVSST